MKRKIIGFGILLLLAVAFTVLAKLADVAPLAPDGSGVGFAALNGAVRDALGVRWGWFDLSEALGYVALTAAGAFALLGLWQLLRRRSLRKVDRNLLILGGLYAAVLALYVFFELVPINLRPVLMPGESAPEPSFPSSHTLLSCTVMVSAAHQLGFYLRGKTPLRVLRGVCYALAALTVCGRLLSGVHWFTDILGGLCFAAALLYGYFIAFKREESE